MLSAKHKTAAQLLAAGATGREIGAALRLNENTITRWRKLPEFQSYLLALLKEGERASLESLYALRSKAVERISALLTSENEAVALRAAEAILDRTVRPLELAHKFEADTTAVWARFMKLLEARSRAGEDHVG